MRYVEHQLAIVKGKWNMRLLPTLKKTKKKQSRLTLKGTHVERGF